MAIHSNGTITTASYSKANYYAQGSGYSQTGFTWPWDHSGTRYYEYQKSNYYSNANYYANYGETTYSSTNYDSHTLSPTVSGSFTPSSGQIRTSTVLIDLSSVISTFAEGFSLVSSTLYYSFSSDEQEWGQITFLATTTTSSYTWDVSTYAPGYYKLYVTVSDGTQSSAMLSNGVFVADHSEIPYQGTLTSAQTATTIDNTSYDTIQYLQSDSIRLIKYTPPTWVTDVFSAEAIEQLHESINDARTGFGLTSFTFSLTSVVDNFTLITAHDMLQMREASDAVNVLVKGSSYEWTNTITEVANTYDIQQQDILDLRDLLNNLV